ncbi:transglutaminase-like putative cysteine protease [Arthrobacter sp. PvP102]|jgi:transglutaminase-like putative cysteine protease|uniref:transglutaminase-like domain-containing protein n=1 Tax=unclassified Arthrobacter TaxID=235627 RepID=UPI0000526F5E|nr:MULTISPECIES: transglutaminase family protein [unclassified Arthrobacter]ABK03932.1 transglutaminase domain protein [Arthrobacter sp. FB24]MBP1231860.1 transglutaminase-like putative cysteine protease [Arthrobacter sp. PvP103]MBP1236995.1 transglutaminase-like putative cysteine protease [Arthrobacter sp. PvP102]
MERSVAARLVFKTAAETKVALAVAVARNAGYSSLVETMSVTSGEDQVPVTELSDHHGGRFHYMEFAEPTEVTVDYTATVSGLAVPEEPNLMELIRYVRPSRYAESDRLLPTAYAEFGGLQGEELLHAVRNWVFSELRYVSGSSRGTDGAVETLLHRRGVCRDFAHLAISLLRSKDVPARLVAVYAPGLSPMDFHAVAEAYINGAWYVIDPTGLAPRESMLRITAGRDSSDTAFLSTVGGSLSLRELRVTAVVDGELPREDPAKLVAIS